MEHLQDMVMEFITKIRNGNKFDEGLYDAIYDELSAQKEEWLEEGGVPLETFETCMYLIDVLAGGNRHLPEADAEKLETANDEILMLLTEQE